MKIKKKFKDAVQKDSAYIAGKITGLDNFKEIFAEAEAYLKAKGLKVMNPTCLPEGFSWGCYMPVCFSMIDVCESVAFLPNWESSEGAKLEHEYAKKKGKNIVYLYRESPKQYAVRGLLTRFLEVK